MVQQALVNKYAHCGTYEKGTPEYKEFDEMTDFQLSELTIELEKLGFTLTYNVVEDCYCVA